jgi:hypothetical protein
MCENFECSNGPCLSIARCKFSKVKHFVHASERVAISISLRKGDSKGNGRALLQAVVLPSHGSWSGLWVPRVENHLTISG